MQWLSKLKDIVKYLPAIWAAVKVIWVVYKARVKAQGYQEALKDETRKRAAAEAKLHLNERRAGTDDERLARLRREAEARQREDS